MQDPNEAEYPDMPMAVLNSVEVDGCVSLAEMGNMIHQMTSVKEGAPTILCEEVKAESEIAEKVAIGIDVVSAIGEATIYSCPHCGGGLWKITNGNVEHYRCHIGHSLSERDLLIKQAEQVESTLWVAMRILEERRNLLKKLEREHKQKGYKRIASDHADRAIQASQPKPHPAIRVRLCEPAAGPQERKNL